MIYTTEVVRDTNHREFNRSLQETIAQMQHDDLEVSIQYALDDGFYTALVVAEKPPADLQ